MIECPAFWIEKDCRHKTSQNRSSAVAATTFWRLETLERRSGGCVDALAGVPNGIFKEVAQSLRFKIKGSARNVITPR